MEISKRTETKMKIYMYSLGRSKGPKGCSIMLAKKKLLSEGTVCGICKKEFDKSHYLQLEHKIPVYLGGNIFEISNQQLICNRCHKIKTSIDKRIIFFLKGVGVIDGNNFEGTSCIPIDKLEKLYFQLFKLAKHSYKIREIWNRWDDKSVKVIRYRRNREVLE